MADRLLTFAQAIKKTRDQKRHLLLGNGFSVGFRPDIFSYRSMTEKSKHLSPELRKVFDGMGIVDFEEVIRSLETAATICKITGIANNFKSMADEIRNALIETIAEHHPDLPFAIDDDQFENCAEFLHHFSTIYTLNYDMLVYWVLMRDNFTDGRMPKTAGVCADGFGYAGEDFLNYTGEPEPCVHFLHGALHLFENVELEKLNYRATQVPLKEQFSELIFQKKKLPLFVTEGDSQKKMARINRSGYLSRCYRSLKKIGGTRANPGALFIYGASLASTDDHIVKALVKNKCRDFYIGIYGDPSNKSNADLMAKAQLIAARRGEEDHKGKRTAIVNFFDSSTAKVWG